jgi:hypothetical protein
MGKLALYGRPLYRKRPNTAIELQGFETSCGKSGCVCQLRSQHVRVNRLIFVDDRLPWDKRGFPGFDRLAG